MSLFICDAHLFTYCIIISFITGKPLVYRYILSNAGLEILVDYVDRPYSCTLRLFLVFYPPVHIL